MKNLKFTISSGDAVSSRLSCAGVNTAGKAERSAVLDCWGLSPAVLDWSLEGSEGWEEKDWIELTRTELLVLNVHILIDWIWYFDFSSGFYQWIDWNMIKCIIHLRFMNHLKTVFYNLNYRVKRFLEADEWSPSRPPLPPSWPPWPAAWRSWTPTPANLFVSDPPRCRDCGSMIECNLDPETWTII